MKYLTFALAKGRLAKKNTGAFRKNRDTDGRNEGFIHKKTDICQ